jgi:hypothetical protein
MLQLKTRHRVLLASCAVLALGQVYPNSFCVTINPGDWRRAPECIVSAPGCYAVSGLCKNDQGADVQYFSYLIREGTYEVCHNPGYTVCYRCRVLDSRLRCVEILYYDNNACTGNIICVGGPQVNRCETDTSGCGSG